MNALTRFRPSRTLSDLQGEVDRLFGEFMRPFSQEAEGAEGWRPRTDLSESDGSYRLSLDLPGVEKEDIQIDLQNHTLTVRGEREEEHEEEGERYHRIERRSGSFYRSFTLPDLAEDAEAKAVFEDGVLKITLPKTGESSPKRIEIR